MRQAVWVSIFLSCITACSEQPGGAADSGAMHSAASTGAAQSAAVVVEPAVMPLAESSTQAAQPAEVPLSNAAEEPVAPAIATLESQQVLQQLVEQKVEQSRPALRSIEAKPMPAVQLVSAQAIPVLGPAVDSSIDQDVTTQRILNRQQRKVLAELPETDRFVKMDNQGQAQLAEADSWNCVMDRKSGLIWETKADGSQRHWQHTYSLSSRNGQCGAADCSVEAYVARVNKLALCGRSDWRLPNKAELLRLVDYAQIGTIPSIDIRYFSNTQQGRYWSADDFELSDQHAWSVSFSDGVNYIHRIDNVAYLRLVSGE